MLKGVNTFLIIIYKKMNKEEILKKLNEMPSIKLIDNGLDYYFNLGIYHILKTKISILLLMFQNV